MIAKHRQIFIGILVAALLAILGYYFFVLKPEREEIVPDPFGSETVEGEKNTDDGSSVLPDVSVINEDNLVFEEVPIDDVSVPAPNVNRSLTFLDSMSDEVRALYREKFIELTGTIKETGGTVSEWLSLGILFKQIGDYEGARLAWEYVSAIRPDNNISFLNLGNLYHYYLKDYPKAEKSFKKGIENDPSYVSAHLGLHELYKYSYKQNTAAAIEALRDGLVATNNNINLLVPLALYYAENGDTDNARTYYEQALLKAQENGDDARAALIEAELGRL